MDVIGNNIANVNTTAFKAKQMNFSDMLYQTTQAATGANAANGTGGTNPRQIGLGVKAAAINTTITQEGANQSTGNPFDLKLTGEAFFVVSDGTSTFYTRDGSFDVDDAGNLVMASTGYIVQGWGVNQQGEIVQGNLGGINVTALDTFNAAGTTSARINGIIDSLDSALENRTSGGAKVTVPIYDRAGYTYNLQFGILPALNPAATKERNVKNTENIYTMPQTIYQADTSEMTFSYAGFELASIDSPEATAKLKQDIWNEIHGNPNGTKIITGTHTFGAKDSITVNLKQFFANNPDLKVDGSSELLRMEKLQVNFSGEVGYVAPGSNGGTPTVPYPIDKATVIDADVVRKLYTVPQQTTSSFAACTLDQNISTGTVTVVATAQTYVDDQGESVTEYKYEYVDKSGTKQPITVTDAQSDAMRKLLQLKSGDGQTNQFTTREYMTDENSVIPGEFTIKLLGMTDSNKNEVSEISRILDDSEFTIKYNTGNGDFEYVGSDGNNSFTINLSTINDRGNFENLSIDLSGTSNTDNSKQSSLTGAKLDGRKVGTRTGVSVGTDGIVTALYSNGMSRKLGQICVATFPNAMGLENSGDNLYQTTASSGDVNIVDIKASGTGVITSGILEMSNVDLSQQFTDMITTQRGFQANSRIITTSDSLLEELVNLKR